MIQGNHSLEETKFPVQTFKYRPVLSASKHQCNVPAHTEGYLITQGLYDEGLCGGEQRGIVIEIVISAVLRESKRGHRSEKEISEELCRASEPLGKGIDEHGGGFPLLREIILNTAQSFERNGVREGDARDTCPEPPRIDAEDGYPPTIVGVVPLEEPLHVSPDLGVAVGVHHLHLPRQVAWGREPLVEPKCAFSKSGSTFHL